MKIIVVTSIVEMWWKESPDVLYLDDDLDISIQR